MKMDSGETGVLEVIESGLRSLIKSLAKLDGHTVNDSVGTWFALMVDGPTVRWRWSIKIHSAGFGL